MQKWSGSVPWEFPPARIERVQDAIFRPPISRAVARLSGVYRRDGSAVDLSAANSPEHGPPVPGVIPSQPVKYREGAWVFGGIIQRHFGHALMDSTSRFWAVKRLRDEGVNLRGILFFQRGGEVQEGPLLPKNPAKIFRTFDPGVPIATSLENEVVEELYVPSNGISSALELIIGVPEQREFFRDCAARIPPKGPLRDIYISRQEKDARGTHMFEPEIERVLSDAGYEIFHPAAHSLVDQIATFRSARRLISIDGSALHTAAMAISAETKVAVISRRSLYAWVLADQLRAFAGCDAHVIAAHTDLYKFSETLTRSHGWSSAYALTDFPMLGRELVKHGFLDAEPVWRTKTEADIRDFLAEAKRQFGDELVLVPEHIRKTEPGYDFQPA